MRTLWLIILVILLGGAGNLLAQNDDLTPAQRRKQARERSEISDGFIYHTVKPGETLFSLSRMYGVPREVLAEINELEGGLKAGTIVRIPVSAGADSADVSTGSSGSGSGSGSGSDPNFYDDHQASRERRTPYYLDGVTGVPEIALMLPLAGTKPGGNDFIEFYKGALLALEDLKNEGRSLNVTLYDTARSAEKVNGIVSSPDFLGTDLIIGPVYEAEMAPALRYADSCRIPIVSPLATIHTLDSEALYQMAPDPATEYDKLHGLLGGESNIILVSSGPGNDDVEFEHEIVAELDALGMRNYGRYIIKEASRSSGNTGKAGSEIASLIDWRRENVFVVLAGTELGVDRALASISSAYNNASATSGRRADISVVGSSKWAGYNHAVDKNLFFKLNVTFVTPYYIDRSNPDTTRFENRYFTLYGNFPTRSAYRGYDAFMLFAGALFEPGFSFDDRLERVGDAPLGTPYRFVRTDGHRRRVNTEWTMVSFSSNYDITVE